MQDKVICPRCGDEISLTGTHRCVEHPAHGEVKVSQAAREFAASVMPFEGIFETLEWDGVVYAKVAILRGDGDDHPTVQAVARFEQSLTTPPATDVALREAIRRVQKLADTREAGVQRDARHRGSNPDPAYHRSHATVASVPLIDLQTLLAALSAPTPPDQPQIGDETLRQALWSALRFAGSRSAITAEQEKAILATWDARAAIPAMPKEDIWEEAQFLVDRIAGWEDWSLDVETLANEWNGHVAPPLSRLRKRLAALRDRRAK